MKIEEKIYTFLCVMFTVTIVLNNLTYQKFVKLLLPFNQVEISVGAILYPITFLITDLIAELYGKAKANFCVTTSIFLNLIVVMIIFIMDSLPATSWSKINDSTFHNVFGFYGVAFVGSILACYISQTLDVYLYISIKKLTKNSLLWLRNLGSTSISLFIDTCVVIIFLTLFGILEKEHMLELIINSYSWKLFFTFCSVPIFYILVSVSRLIMRQNSDKILAN